MILNGGETAPDGTMPIRLLVSMSFHTVNTEWPRYRSGCISGAPKRSYSIPPLIIDYPEVFVIVWVRDSKCMVWIWYHGYCWVCRAYGFVTESNG